MEYQRQIHLQRLAEQEAEMQARLDQQRRYAQQREQQNQVNDHIDQHFKSNLPSDAIIYSTSQFTDWLLSTSHPTISISTTTILNGT